LPGGPRDFRMDAHLAEKFSFRGRETLPIVPPSLALMLFVWPLLWVAWSFLTRGGLSWRIAGLALVRPDGRPASRLQCAWRAVLVWFPLTALLALSAGLEVWYWMNWQPDEPGRDGWMLWLSLAAWWSAVMLLV